MTEHQGYSYKIENKISNYITHVMCQSLNNTFDNEAFTKKIIEKFANKFNENLFNYTSKTYYDLFDSKKYKQDIQDGILDGIENNKRLIRSMINKEIQNIRGGIKPLKITNGTPEAFPFHLRRFKNKTRKRNKNILSRHN